MATSHQSSVQDQMADVTECSICTDVYTNPKILPCVHTFCLQCLETYGSEKKKGDKMACPICRSECLIPDGGLGSLPNNFFISKIMEIRKLSETSTNEALCGTCPDEGRVKAKLFCFQCEQNLCERCRIAHSKMKLCQNHQVVEIGNKLKLQEVNFRSSYCDQHPGELVKMYCEDDKATICILCFAESHQSHKCLSVTKASEEFSTAIKTDLKTVLERLPEFQTARAQFEKMEKDFLAHIVVVEKQIFDEAARLKALIDSHANILTQKLTAFKDERLTEIKSIKEDADRFKVTIESYARYSEELLSKGAPGDICQEADQLTNRARHLVSMTESGFSVDFNCDGVTFKTLNLEDILRMKNVDNVIGDVQEDSMSDHLALPATHGTVIRAITSRQHQFEKKEVKVEPYYPWLGQSSASASSGKVPATTKSESPTSLTLTFDPRAVHFILKRQELQKQIEDSLEKFNCCIVWPSQGKVEVKLEFKGKEKQKPTSGWDVESMKVLQKYADELTWKKEIVLQEIWNDFKKKIQEHIAEKSKLLDTFVEDDQCEIQYIGLKNVTDEFEKLFKKIKGDLEEELERKKKRISETVTTLRPHQLDLIRTEEFKNNLKQKLPDLEFEVKQTEMNLCGLPEVVKKARLFMLERVAMAAQDSFEVSEPTSKVFAKGEAKPYLMEQLLSKGISASWTCNDRTVIVYAFDNKKVKELVEVLKNEVVEKRLQLSALNLCEDLDKSRGWKDFIGCLCKEDKLLEVSVNESFLIVAGMKSSFEKNKRRIENFLAKNNSLYYPYGLLFKSHITYQWQ